MRRPRIVKPRWLEPEGVIKDRPPPKPIDGEAAEHRRRVAETRINRERVFQLELPVEIESQEAEDK